MRDMYCDHDGHRISIRDWERLFSDQAYRWPWRDEIGDITVSTAWLGLDHGWGSVRQLFETMILKGDRVTGRVAEDRDLYQWRYPDKESAQAGHAAVVAWVKAGMPPDSEPE